MQLIKNIKWALTKYKMRRYLIKKYSQTGVIGFLAPLLLAVSMDF